MNGDIGAQHPLSSDPSSFSEVPAGQHLTLGRMAEILRESGCVVYASSEPPIPKAAIERLPEAFITSNSGDGKYYVKIAVKSMADLYKWHDAAIIAARGPDVEPYAWQYAKSNGDDTWSVHIDRLGQKPAVHENFEPKALYLAGSLPYLSATPSPIEDVAGPSEAEIEDAYQEGYNEGYEEGKSEWKSVKAQLWNAMQQWLTLRHGLDDTTGEGYTVSNLLEGLAEVEAENKRLRALSAPPSRIEDVAEPSEEEGDLRKKLEMSEKRYATLRKAYDRERRRNQSPILGSACGDEDQAFSQAYYLVAGESPHWSPDFGVAEALVEIKDKMDGFRAALLASRRVRPSPVDEDARDGVLEAAKAANAAIAMCLSAGGVLNIALGTPWWDAIIAAQQKLGHALQSQRKG